MQNILAQYLFESSVIDESIYSFQELLESRLDFIKGKYKGAIDDVVDHLANHVDPSKNKKYTEWLTDRHLKGDDVMHPEVHRDLKAFDQANSKYHDTNIKNHTIQSMRDVAHMVRSDTKEKPATKLEHVFSENGVEGYKIPNKETSIAIYGHGRKHSTNWCTAADSGSNMFDTYTGGKYTCHLPNGQFFQIHHQSYQARDPEDDSITSFSTDHRYKDHANEIKKFFEHTSALEGQGNRSKLTKIAFGHTDEELDDIVAGHMQTHRTGYSGDDTVDFKNALSQEKLKPEHIEIAKSTIPGHEKLLAHNPHLDADSLRHFARESMKMGDYTGALHNPNMPSDVVHEALFNSPNVTMHDIGEHHNISKEHISTAIDEHHEKTPFDTLVRSPNVKFSPEHFDKLLAKKDYASIYSKANHQKLPDNVSHDTGYQNYKAESWRYAPAIYQEKHNPASTEELHRYFDYVSKRPGDLGELETKYLSTAKNVDAHLTHRLKEHLLNGSNVTGVAIKNKNFSDSDIEELLTSPRGNPNRTARYSAIDAYTHRKNAKFSTIKKVSEKTGDRVEDIRLTFGYPAFTAAPEHSDLEHPEFARGFADAIDHHKKFDKTHLDSLITGLSKTENRATSDAIRGIMNHPALNPDHIKRLAAIHPTKSYQYHIIANHPRTPPSIAADLKSKETD